MPINQQLNTLYSSKWNGFLKMQGILNNEGIFKYSSPLLMYCWEKEYDNCNKKLLFIGQKPNSWFDPGSSLGKNSLNQVISNYKDFELGKDYKAGFFWKFVHELNRQFNNSDYCYLWTNVNKLSKDDGKGRLNSRVLELECLYFNILKEELNILKPDAVIFLTGPYYDCDIIKKIGATKFIKCTNHTAREFAQLVNKNLPKKSFRIYNPQYLIFRRMFDEYLDILTNLI